MWVTHITGQQATLAGCIDGDIEQFLYSVISDNTPIFTPEPNEDEILSCMDYVYSWITERHPWTPGEWSYSSSPRKGGNKGSPPSS